MKNNNECYIILSIAHRILETNAVYFREERINSLVFYMHRPSLSRQIAETILLGLKFTINTALRCHCEIVEQPFGSGIIVISLLK